MTYQEFITICTTKNLRIQYEENTKHLTYDGKILKEVEKKNKVTGQIYTEIEMVDGIVHEDIDYYALFTCDGNIKYICECIDPADKLDFETNYKNESNKPIELRDEYGHTIMSPTLENVMGLFPKKKGYKAIGNAGSITFNDVEVTVEKRINGGEWWIMPDSVPNIHEDDYIEFSIIDKNDILGMFVLICANCGTVRTIEQAAADCAECGSQSRFTVGTHILELSRFVETDYVMKGNASEGYHSDLMRGIKGTNLVHTGLFFRCTYYSHGEQSINFIWRLSYYE